MLSSAERGGFEPPVLFNAVRPFSKRVLSASQPPLQMLCAAKDTSFPAFRQHIFFVFFVTIYIFVKKGLFLFAASSGCVFLLCFFRAGIIHTDAADAAFNQMKDAGPGRGADGGKFSRHGVCLRRGKYGGGDFQLHHRHPLQCRRTAAHQHAEAACLAAEPHAGK